VLPSSLPLFLASIDAERIVNGHLGGDKQIGGRRHDRAEFAFAVKYDRTSATLTLEDATVPS